ncbi:type III secretion system gatekeeper subunit SctW [Paludibacterium paludis]|uniref:Invasion protein InvE n=1 Tax=Paludibacterium paludis TaxID=1225769 RepID=A0A918UBQ2_9NEIS|nr:type III secretion system gatekeeper subunit SctW [Paludibacterium paludis]GGY24021.1 invasion protein InvE [Paludibacterium paludis]
MQIRNGIAFPQPRPLETLGDESGRRPVAEGDAPEQLAVNDSALEAMLFQEVSAQDGSELYAAMGRRFRDRLKDERSDFPQGNFDRVLEDGASDGARQLQALAELEEVPFERLFQEARKMFSDDSDLILVLRELMRRKGIKEVVRRRLRQLHDQIEQQADPRRLKAGINCGLKARLFGSKLKVDARLLRETYRQFLENDDSGVPSYEAWIVMYGVEARDRVLRFVGDALIADMNALDPSCHRLEFFPLLARIGTLRVLSSADQLFVGRALATGRLRDLNDSEGDWVAFLLGALQYPDEIGEALDLAIGDRLPLCRAAERSEALQALLRHLSAVPGILFAGDGGRDAALDFLLERASEAFDHEQRERRMTHGGQR